MLAIVICLLALTRAEIIERFKVPPITQCGGFVQVFADCPADMRKEYQIPVASFASDICESLRKKYAHDTTRFGDPGLVVYIGEVRTNMTNVVVRTAKRDNGSRFTRVYIPAPAFADVDAFRLETIKAFFRAVKNEEYDDEKALLAYIDSDLNLRARYEYGELAKWADGGKMKFNDEYYLKLSRSIIIPGYAKPADVLRYASRLWLYPETHDVPFCSKVACCTFAEAIELAGVDPRVRIAAYKKAPFAVAFGGGHGEDLAAAADAYSKFLFALAAYKAPKEELEKMLSAADALLSAAYQKALDNEKDNNGQYY